MEEVTVVAGKWRYLVVLGVLKETDRALLVLVGVSNLAIVLLCELIEFLLVQVLYELGSGGDPLGLLVLASIVEDHGDQDTHKEGDQAALEHLDIADDQHNEGLGQHTLATYLV